MKSMKNQFNDKHSRRKNHLLRIQSAEDGKFRSYPGQARRWHEANEQKKRQIRYKVYKLFENEFRFIPNIFLKDAAWAFTKHACKEMHLMRECIKEVWDRLGHTYLRQQEEEGVWLLTLSLREDDTSEHYEKIEGPLITQYNKIKERIEFEKNQAREFLEELSSL